MRNLLNANATFSFKELSETPKEFPGVFRTFTFSVKITAAFRDPVKPVFYTNRLFQTADRRGYARMADDEALKTVTLRRMI